MEVTGGMVFVEGYSLVVAGGGALGNGPHWFSIVEPPVTTNNFQFPSVDSDAGGNIYVTGSYTPATSSDIVIAKYNPSGNIIWSRTLGGIANDYGSKIKVDSAGNQYVLGDSNTSGGAGSYDYVVAKYNTNGDIQWQKSLGTAQLDSATDADIDVDSVGNPYIVSQTSGNILVFKYDTAGSLQWQRSLGTAAAGEAGYGIKIDNSGNIHILGNTTTSNLNFYLAKITNDGTIVQQASYGDANDNYPRAMTISASGNIYFTGYSIVSGFATFNIVKCDNTGNIVWSRKISDDASYFSPVPRAIAVDSSENIYVSGVIENKTNGISDMHITKYNSSGVNLWQRRFGQGNISATDAALSMRVTTSGDLLVGGYTSALAGVSKALLLKLPSDGTLTGNYGSYVYDSVAQPESAITLNTNTSIGMSLTTTALTENTRTFTNSSIVFTNTLTNMP